ncbi:MAG: PAS domain S-box protein [Geobacteraceae bacterium]|nr:PAS domain S-box protein [Geobacteraceae bacterium]
MPDSNSCESRSYSAGEARDRSLICKVRTAIVLHDGQGRILDSNPLAQELLGLSAEQLLGTSLMDPEWHFLREDGSRLPVAEFPVSLVLSSRQPLRDYVAGISRPDRDAVTWVLANAEPEYAADGDISQVIVSFVDITGRRQVEKELAERVMLAELTTDIGCALATQGDLRSMLQACAEVLVRYLDVAFARIWTLAAAENCLELQASAGMYTRTDGSHSRVPVGEFKIGLIASEHQPHITNAVIGDPRVHDQEWAKREGMVAFAGHPLTVADRLVGVMAMFSRNRLSAITLKALASVANEIAIGIERKRAEDERLVHLRFFENMDRVNHAIQGANDLEQLMRDVLDAALVIFDCDRAWLLYPCDPEAASWSVPMERTKPEYPGANVQGLVIPMDPEVQRVFRIQRATDGPVSFGAGSEYPLPEWIREQFGVQSQVTMVTYPKTGKPWASGMHQCSHARTWQPEELRLFQEINRRLADGLTSLLSRRDLQESEAKYRRIVDTANEGVWAFGPDAITTFVNARMAEMLGYSAEEMIGRPVTDFMFEEDAPDHLMRLHNRRQGQLEHYERRFHCKDGETVWTIVSAAPLLDDDRTFKGSFAMFTNITEIKRTEGALKRLNEELEQRVRQRTVELEEKNAELKRLNRVFVGRELKMIELKEKIRELEKHSEGLNHES